MLFKSLNLYSVTTESNNLALINDLKEMEIALQTHLSTPLDQFTSSRLGWCPVNGKPEGATVLEFGHHRLMAVKRQWRWLPGPIVNDQLEESVQAFEQKHQRSPSTKEKTELKEGIIDSMMPEAYVRRKIHLVWWNIREGFLGIDASSRAEAEDVLNLLRESLGSLCARPLAMRNTPAKKLTDWLTTPASRPEWLTLGKQASFVDKNDKVKFTASNADLDQEEAQTMLANNFQVTSLSFSIEGEGKLTLDESFTLKSIKLADAILREAEPENNEYRFEAQAAASLQSMERMIMLISQSMGGYETHQELSASNNAQTVQAETSMGTT